MRKSFLIVIFTSTLLSTGCATPFGRAAESLSGRAVWGYCQQAGQGTRCDIRRAAVLEARDRCEGDGGSAATCAELGVAVTCPGDDPSRACPPF